MAETSLCWTSAVSLVGRPMTRSVTESLLYRSRYSLAFGLPAREALPAGDDDIAIEGIDLKAKADATGPLRGDERAARAQKEIQDRIPRQAAVLDGPLDQGERLHRRMRPRL